MAAKADSLSSHFADLEQQHEVTALGMWIFLATELMFFGGLFTAYAIYRHWYPGEFAAASRQLNLVYGAVNTVVLLTSSLTMALAVHAARLGRRDGLTRRAHRVQQLCFFAAQDPLLRLRARKGKFHRHRQESTAERRSGIRSSPARGAC